MVFFFSSAAENDEQVEDQAASESQSSQRWAVTQLPLNGVSFFSCTIQAARARRRHRLKPGNSLLPVDPHGRNLEARSSTLYINLLQHSGKA